MDYILKSFLVTVLKDSVLLLNLVIIFKNISINDIPRIYPVFTNIINNVNVLGKFVQ